MELEDLKGLGPVRINRLRAMGINSLRDLLYFFPIRYEDHLHVTPIANASDGNVLIRGIIYDKPKISYFRGLSRVTARIQDQSGFLSVCWFNEPWMVQQLPTGQEVLLYGPLVRKKYIQLQNPKLVTEPGLKPVYHAIRGIPNRTIQQMIREALSAAESVCPENLPASLIERYHLISLAEALRSIHFPEDQEQAVLAGRRLAFENMLIYLMGVCLLRHQGQKGFPMEIAPEDPALFWKGMPFPPTDAQRRVLEEIAEDMRKNQAMSRLVQGDVGCGKTALAFGALYLAFHQGYQSAMMAPTEILAKQHYESAKSQLQPFGIACELLTGSTKAAERKRILKALADHTCHVVFGTHALISQNVQFKKLGLVITDEQHRFGVRQRSILQEKGTRDDGVAPHVLVMSATPIPRTLALILYGDLHLSMVDELPPGRIPVKTRLVPEEKREAMYQFLREKVQNGQQAYVICPMVEDSENDPHIKSVQTLYAELSRKELKGLRVGITWGGQKHDDKSETMRRFQAGELDVLVSTTVIEVGVNVPKATLMIIENADRYGLSQLHQLRGRVGRGPFESWCFLMSDAGQKLRILCETNDGFLVAQKDLELRGPGDLMGTRQSGDSFLNMTGSGDVRLLSEVQGCVAELENRPELDVERRTVEMLSRKYFEQHEFRLALN